ncbi:MAG: PH domain-containing protein [Muribaculaceae bacterium]|nr:PH domain-containing protein [Muribaculaceae bacterium]
MILLALIVVLCLIGLFYSPMILRLTDDSLNVETSFRVKKFPLSEIEEVKICPPTMAERRIFGSGGFMGYWGWFRESSIGKYFAFYGQASQTFLIRMKSGRQYMLGCSDSTEMAEALTDRLPLC